MGEPWRSFVEDAARRTYSAAPSGTYRLRQGSRILRARWFFDQLERVEVKHVVRRGLLGLGAGHDDDDDENVSRTIFVAGVKTMRPTKRTRQEEVGS